MPPVNSFDDYSLWANGTAIITWLDILFVLVLQEKFTPTKVLLI